MKGGKAKTVGNAKEKYLIFMKTSSENNQTMRASERGEGEQRSAACHGNLNVQASCGLVAAHVHTHTHIVAAHVCVCMCVLMFALQLVRVRV